MAQMKNKLMKTKNVHAGIRDISTINRPLQWVNVAYEQLQRTFRNMGTMNRLTVVRR